MSKSQTITPQDVIAANEARPGKFIVIDEDHGRQPKTKQGKGTVTYYTTNIILADGRQVPCKLKVRASRINGCKSPEEREKIAVGLAPGFSVNRSTVSTERTMKGANGSKITVPGDPVGEAMYLIGKAWQTAAENSNIPTRKGVNPIIQESYDQHGKLAMMDDPLSRIKLRVNGEELAAEIKIVTESNGIVNVSEPNKTPDGQKLTTQNVHEYFRGGSTAMYVVDYSTTCLSSQGLSNHVSANAITITPSKGYKLSVDEQFDQSDIDDLRSMISTKSTTNGSEEPEPDPESRQFGSAITFNPDPEEPQGNSRADIMTAIENQM